MTELGLPTSSNANYGESCARILGERDISSWRGSSYPFEPVGLGTHFVARADRLDNGQTGTWAHSSFLDRSSVPFSPRNKKAKRVIVTAKDLDGKTLQVEVPFKS